MYYTRAKERLEQLKKRGDILVLAFESSCDDTAVAITRGNTVLANVISSQIEIHALFGGVVPEIASRNHILAIDNLLELALKDAGVVLKDIEVIAVTYGSGLLGALLVGISYAKALAFALDVPFVGIDHIKGHICANFISSPALQPPFITLLASGGHTAVARYNGYFDSEILGQTVDDAAGEAFDKVARALKLSYPGGPSIEKAAIGGTNSVFMPKPFKGENNLNFSYSGLKTSVINYIHNSEAKGNSINIADVACSFQTMATSILVEHAVRACEKTGIKRIALAGGVGANECLRQALVKACNENGLEAYLPPKALCTDNAAMIGVACYHALLGNATADDLCLDANLSL